MTPPPPEAPEEAEAPEPEPAPEPQRVVVEVQYPEPPPAAAEPQPLPVATPVLAKENDESDKARPPLVLTGIITSAPRVAVLRRGAERYIVQAGDDLAGEATVSAIAEDSVTLDRHGEEEIILLRTGAEAKKHADH